MDENKELMISEFQDKAEHGAIEYFKTGLNCSEAVFKSLLDLNISTLPPETVAIASGFGGGIGKTKHTCGAILGACMAIGLTQGRPDPLAKETMHERIEELYGVGGIYELYEKVVHEFEDTYGSIECSELNKPYDDWESRDRKRNCKNIIAYSARLAAKYAMK